jgi:putative hemolysin
MRAHLPSHGRASNLTLSPDRHRLFRLDAPQSGPLASKAARSLEWLLWIDQLNRTYDSCAGAGDCRTFLRRVLDDLGVSVRVSDGELARIPKKGPVVVVANHPFGALDGIILASVLASVRTDVRVMANHLLGRIRELSDLFLFVDPFGGTSAAAANVGPMRQSLRHLKEGGLLAAFPAGEVAHLNLRDRRVTDPRWNDTISRIVRRTGAAVLPVYFDGRNGPLFQLLGLIHPRLRTAMLPRELYKKRGGRIELRIGSLLPGKRLGEIDSDEDLTEYLRRRVFLLGHRPAKPAKLVATGCEPVAPGITSGERVVDPVSPDLLAADVASLPREQVLIEHEGYQVVEARAAQIRSVLREIGRLREVTFRTVGEGTGKAIDLDTFDYDYVHLFIWHPANRQVVGAYRLGRSDELLAAKGRLGLYTSTLFNYSAELLHELGPSLEMGRSFVRVEHQRSYLPLLLLWRGIGRYCVKEPRYRRLFGPVSISNAYQTVSKQLMVQFLQLHHAATERRLVRPRHPFHAHPIPGVTDGPGGSRLARLMSDSDEVSSLVADVEPDQKGLPVLVRQYLKLGAKFLSFNVDPQFSDSLDGLIVVDLAKTEPRVLERYMGKEGYASFISRHRTALPPTTDSAIR